MAYSTISNNENNAFTSIKFALQKLNEEEAKAAILVAMKKTPNRDKWFKEIQKELMEQVKDPTDRDAVPAQVSDNLILSSRIDFRKAMSESKTIEDIIQHGTPEEKAAAYVQELDAEEFDDERYITPEQEEALKNSFNFDEEEDEEERLWKLRELNIFWNYIKLYSDIRKYVDKIGVTFQAYQLELTRLARLIDRYEAIQRDRDMYQLIYDCRLHGTGENMKYSIGRNKASLGDSPQPLEKKLSDTTPESLLEEFNAAHKDDGVIFRDNVKGELHRGEIYDHNEVKIHGSLNEDGSGTLIADIDFKGGLYDQIKKQAKPCEDRLKNIKEYVEALQDYVKRNAYEKYVPYAAEVVDRDMKAEETSKPLIAREYHISYLKAKRDKGEAITPLEEYEAVLPDYNEVQTKEENVRGLTKVLYEIRNTDIRETFK